MRVILALLACGPADRDTFLDERVDVVCERTRECYSAEELAAVGMDEDGACEAALHLQAQLEAEEACDYRSGQAYKCLSGYRRETCEEFTAGIEPEGCGAVCDDGT